MLMFRCFNIVCDWPSAILFRFNNYYRWRQVDLPEQRGTRMNPQTIIAQFGIYAGTLIVCFISGFIPIINTELFLIVLSFTIPKKLIFPVITLAAIGQMAAKTILFLGGRGVLKISIKKYQDKMEQVRRKMDVWKFKIDFLIFISALTSFPPFYIVVIVAGTLPMSLSRFFIAGFAGRFLRFGLMMLFPQLVKKFLL